MNKLATVSVQGGEYATVPTRLKAFREANPRADISTEHSFTEDGNLIFKATIIQDRANDTSAKATGHSFGRMTGAKAFEKQETISIGRALAVLGYLNNGQIATSEEMEEFESFKAEKFEELIKNAESVEQLMEVFNTMDALAKKEFTPMLSERKKELTDGQPTTV